MEFEFDSDKNKTNLEKHGIDFDEAKALWLDVNAVEIPAKSETEIRKVLIAELGGKVWAAIFTERGDKVRIISVRRAHKSEEISYEQR